MVENKKEKTEDQENQKDVTVKVTGVSFNTLLQRPTKQNLPVNENEE